MDIYFMGSSAFEPTNAGFAVMCPKHQVYVPFFLSALEITAYRGSVEELKQVTAHEAVLAHCPECKREQVPALPATRFPEGVEL
jgi:hypothetical protein